MRNPLLFFVGNPKKQEINKASLPETFGQVTSKTMASAVMHQPTSSKTEEEEETANKISEEKTLMTTNPAEQALKKILPDQRFLKKMPPTFKSLAKVVVLDIL